MILLAGLCTAAVSQAQQPVKQQPDGAGIQLQTQWDDVIDNESYNLWRQAITIPAEITLTVPDYIAPYSAHWKERQSLKIMQERARQSVLMLPQAANLRDPNENVGLWKVTVGNTARHNWSPFLDVYLDARAIKYPLPKNMTPDKRPMRVQQLEKLGNK